MKNFIRKIISFSIIVSLFAVVCNCKKDSKQPELDNESIVISDEKPFVPAEAPVLLLPVEQYDSEEDFEWEILNEGKREGETVLITGYLGGKSEINIPPRIYGIPVTVIGKYAFSIEDSPENIRYIGKKAFGCNLLSSLYIPETVRGIDDYAFKENQIESVTFNGNHSYMNKTIFFGNETKTFIFGDSVTSIMNYAFSGYSHITDRNNKLTKLFISYFVRTIRQNAFRDNQITSIILNERNNSIWEGAFRGNQITNVTFNLNYHNSFIIDEKAFADNPITSVVITVKNNSMGNYINPEITNLWADAFPNNFIEFLRNNNMMAGTYTYDGRSWNTDNLNPGIRIVPWSYEISE